MSSSSSSNSNTDFSSVRRSFFSAGYDGDVDHVDLFLEECGYIGWSVKKLQRFFTTVRSSPVIAKLQRLLVSGDNIICRIGSKDLLLIFKLGRFRFLIVWRIFDIKFHPWLACGLGPWLGLSLYSFCLVFGRLERFSMFQLFLTGLTTGDTKQSSLLEVSI